MFNDGENFRYYGEHAKLTDDLLLEKGGIFATVYDVLFTSAIIGYLDKNTSKVKGDRSYNKTIFSGKLISESTKTDFIARTLLLADEHLDLEDEKNGRISRALRNFNEVEIEKKNREYLIGYALRGIEILHDKFQEGKSKKKDVIEIVQELIDEYTSENNSFKSINDLILEYSKL